jgi:glycosyltransferase involved in cell wall biosynthesis
MKKYPVSVSVIIPTYNYANFIIIAINSILSQTFPLDKIEIIVIDDGSTDNTQSVLEPFVQKNLIKYFFQPNSGKANATLKGIQKSTGKYIFNLDADDYFLEDKIQLSVNEYEGDDNVVHVATPAQILYQDAQIFGVEDIPAEIMNKGIDGKYLLKRFYNHNILYGGGSTYSARSSVLKAIQIPDAVDMYIDEFLILALLPFGKSVILEKPLSVWRVHSSNYSGKSGSIDGHRKKINRLLTSSTAILNFLEQENYDRELIKIYKVLDENRKLDFNRSLEIRDKGINTLTYSYNIFIKIRPPAHIIIRYKVFNKLIPFFLYKLLKKIIHK